MDFDNCKGEHACGRTTGACSAGSSSGTVEERGVPRRHPPRFRLRAAWQPSRQPKPTSASTPRLRRRRRAAASRSRGWGRGGSPGAASSATGSRWPRAPSSSCWWRAASRRRSTRSTSPAAGRRTRTRPARSRSTARRHSSSRPTARRSARPPQGSTCSAPTRCGRDVMVRLLYGGRNSLFVGFMAAIITVVLAVVFGLLAGYFRGFTDGVISNMFDISGSFPVLLFAIALGTALALGGLNIGPDQHRGRLALDPDRHHRRRLRPVLRPPDPRSGAVAAREGVRGRGASRRAWGRRGSCSARSCRTSPRRSSSSAR